MIGLVREETVEGRATCLGRAVVQAVGAVVCEEEAERVREGGYAYEGQAVEAAEEVLRASRRGWGRPDVDARAEGALEAVVGLVLDARYLWTWTRDGAQVAPTDRDLVRYLGEGFLQGDREFVARSRKGREEGRIRGWATWAEVEQLEKLAAKVWASEKPLHTRPEEVRSFSSRLDAVLPSPDRMKTVVEVVGEAPLFQALREARKVNPAVTVWIDPAPERDGEERLVQVTISLGNRMRESFVVRHDFRCEASEKLAAKVREEAEKARALKEAIDRDSLQRKEKGIPFPKP